MNAVVMLASAQRTWRATFRRPVHLTFSFFQPLFWLLFFGQIMHRYPAELLPAGSDYRSFLVPGICGMTVLLGASQSGIGLIRDMQNGLLQRMLLTPAGHVSLLAGKVLADSLRLVAQALVILVVAYALGMQVHFSPLPLLVGLAALFVFAIAFCSVSCLLALRTRRQESMAAFVHMVNLPVFFTSSALVTREAVPALLRTIVQYNPLSLAVDVLRPATLQGQMSQAMLAWPVLISAATILFVLATRAVATAGRGSAWDSR